MYYFADVEDVKNYITLLPATQKVETILEKYKEGPHNLWHKTL